MHWSDHTIWWQVYPLGFTGAPIREPDRTLTHRLPQLIDWLDYLIDLGANGLLLGPIHESETHGYDTTNPFEIDPRLGTMDDFDALVVACKDRGIRILLDGVFSHVGEHNPDYLRALNEGPDSDAAPLFDIDWDHPDGPRAAVFEGHKQLVRFNHASPLTVAFAKDVLTFWLDRGIDGWRLDAAYSVPPTFWSEVLPEVRAQFPDAWFLGEVIHGDYAGFVQSAHVDSLTEYELWKSIWSSITDNNWFELQWTLDRHNGFLEAFTPNTFIGNHDVTRIATKLGTDAALTAAAILMTVGGIPSIYYGDEQGFEAEKEERHGGDDAIRPAFPANPSELPDSGAKIYRTYQKLVGIRRRHPWLVTARTTMLEVENTRCRYRAQAADDPGAFIEVALDLNGSPSAVITDANNHVLWNQSTDVS